MALSEPGNAAANRASTCAAGGGGEQPRDHGAVTRDTSNRYAQRLLHDRQPFDHRSHLERWRKWLHGRHRGQMPKSEFGPVTHGHRHRHRRSQFAEPTPSVTHPLNHPTTSAHRRQSAIRSDVIATYLPALTVASRSEQTPVRVRHDRPGRSLVIVALWRPRGADRRIVSWAAPASWFGRSRGCWTRLPVTGGWWCAPGKLGSARRGWPRKAP
jgi:hypothetical protein